MFEEKVNGNMLFMSTTDWAIKFSYRYVSWLNLQRMLVLYFINPFKNVDISVVEASLSDEEFNSITTKNSSNHQQPYRKFGSDSVSKQPFVGRQPKLHTTIIKHKNNANI